jgi:hypothetical protein
MVANVGPVELHTPPSVSFVSVMVAPVHTEEGPPITAGNAGTVITVNVAVVEVEPHALVDV